MIRTWIAFTFSTCLVVFVAAPSLTHAHKLNPKLIERITGEKIEEHTEATSTDPRGEERTFASFPEWYIVYNADEYADFVTTSGRPSQFPYFESIGQYWDSVKYSKEALGDTEIDSSTDTVLKFIGASFTFENAVIGAYEKTIGYVSEALNFFKKSKADEYINSVSNEYGEFLLHTPWYDFPYFQKLPGLWSGVLSDLSIRGLERRIIFTIGYTIKGVYGKVIGSISHSSLGFAELETTFTTENISESTLRAIPNVTIGEVYDDGHIRASAPRYRAFKSVAGAIADAGGVFLDIQENNEIMLTVIAPSETSCIKDREDLIFSMPILTEKNTSRFALKTPVSNLHSILQELSSCGLDVEHIYDY